MTRAKMVALSVWVSPMVAPRDGHRRRQASGLGADRTRSGLHRRFDRRGEIAAIVVEISGNLYDPQAHAVPLLERGAGAFDLLDLIGARETSAHDQLEHHRPRGRRTERRRAAELGHAETPVAGERLEQVAGDIVAVAEKAFVEPVGRVVVGGEGEISAAHDAKFGTDEIDDGKRSYGRGVVGIVREPGERGLDSLAALGATMLDEVAAAGGGTRIETERAGDPRAIEEISIDRIGRASCRERV